MLHNADPLPSAKWPGPRAAQESGPGAQGNAAERDGPGEAALVFHTSRGGSGELRCSHAASQHSPPPNPSQTPAVTPAGGAARGQVTILQTVQSSRWAGGSESGRVTKTPLEEVPGGLDRRGRWLRMRRAADLVLPSRPGDPAALATVGTPRPGPWGLRSQ